MSIPQSGGGPIESYEQLAAYMEAGCKPAQDWRIGTEHEKFGYLTADLKPLPYEGAASVRAILEGLRDRFGWEPVMERDAIIGLQRDGANVSLEPGGSWSCRARRSCRCMRPGQNSRATCARWPRWRTRWACASWAWARPRSGATRRCR